MASGDVRVAINAAVALAAAPIATYDLSDYVTLEECLGQVKSKAVLIQYVVSGERATTVGGYGNSGWEEDGSVVLHLVIPAGFISAPVVEEGDIIREALRGQRISADIVIESCEPFTDFGGGAVGLYGGAWKGWASNLFYVKRDCG